MSRFTRPFLVLLLLGSSVLPSGAQRPASPARGYSLARIRSNPFPNELNAAAKANRIVWAFNERGRRNLWVAEGPEFVARQLTQYGQDDGQELTSVQLTADGRFVVYVRGGDHGSNFDDELPVNPMAMPTPTKVQVWVVPFEGGAPRSLGEGDAPVVSPAGDQVAFQRGNQLWLAPVEGAAPAKQLFTARGSNGSAKWSPSGDRLAFVSRRGDHSFLGIYRDAETPIVYVAPSTNRDDSP
ncbi:MAG: hypothetical protein ABIZ91_15485, partial [Gemmatimonadaceae bacterium]